MLLMWSLLAVTSSRCVEIRVESRGWKHCCHHGIFWSLSGGEDMFEISTVHLLCSRQDTESRGTQNTVCKVCSLALELQRKTQQRKRGGERGKGGTC